MEGKCRNMEEEELKEALGDYHSVYVEFINEKTANEKAQVEQLTNKNKNLTRLNERLRKQISETRCQVTKVYCSLVSFRRNTSTEKLTTLSFVIITTNTLFTVGIMYIFTTS